MPSLRDSHIFLILTRHFRAGLSHAAAARLDLSRVTFAVTCCTNIDAHFINP